MHVNNHRGRKINFKEKCLICWGIEVKLIKFQGFKGQTLRQKTFRKLRIFFLFGGGGDLGRSMHYFWGEREHRPSWSLSIVLLHNENPTNSDFYL